jgi:hypothetical protein
MGRDVGLPMYNSLYVFCACHRLAQPDTWSQHLTKLGHICDDSCAAPMA